MGQIKNLLKNYKIIILMIVLVLSIGSIWINRLSYGIDFNGGTQFQIELKEPFANEAQRIQIISIISQRLDATGLQDVTISSWGDRFILAQVAQTDSETVARIEELLRRQGRFEATLDGNLLFTGSDFIQIFQDPSQGYGVFDTGNNFFSWSLPFLLRNEAAKKFTQKSFHQCTVTGFNEGGKEYSCKRTYFFIDRPQNSVIIITNGQFGFDSQEMVKGNVLLDIPPNTSITELIENSKVEVIRIEETLTDEDRNELTAAFTQKKEAIIPDNLSPETKQEIESIGFELKQVPVSPFEPWTWKAIGAKQIIALTPSVTNLEPFVEKVEDAVVYSELIITGNTASREESQKNLNDLTILLQSGSLPVPVKDISKESISPTLGEEFLFTMIIVGIIVIIIVSLTIYFRYKEPIIIIPIIITILSETIIVLGFASIAKWNLDLAALAGLVAAIGTGVDDQIIITDELSKGLVTEVVTLGNRIKRAFFIVFAAASVSIVSLLPILILGFGLGKLTGFAITTIAGVLVGVLITRPAFSEMARVIFARKKS